MKTSHQNVLAAGRPGFGLPPHSPRVGSVFRRFVALALALTSSGLLALSAAEPNALPPLSLLLTGAGGTGEFESH